MAIIYSARQPQQIFIVLGNFSMHTKKRGASSDVIGIQKTPSVCMCPPPVIAQGLSAFGKDNAKIERKNDYSKFLTKKIQNNNFTSLAEMK